MPRKKSLPKPREVYTTTRTIQAELRGREVVERGLVAPLRLTITVKPKALEMYEQEEISAYLRSFDPLNVSYNKMTDKLSLDRDWDNIFDFSYEEGELRNDGGEVITIEREFSRSPMPPSDPSDPFFRR
jgi:hypothetical protein